MKCKNCGHEIKEVTQEEIELRNRVIKEVKETLKQLRAGRPKQDKDAITEWFKSHIDSAIANYVFDLEPYEQEE